MWFNFIFTGLKLNFKIYIFSEMIMILSKKNFLNVTQILKKKTADFIF